ncbi:hypothetical protein Bbelb_043310 [Branchiostoma belcheri]|nr:hypothetical protein Bbelb_043310 [Branchiostoma belcheri]
MFPGDILARGILQPATLVIGIPQQDNMRAEHVRAHVRMCPGYNSGSNPGLAILWSNNALPLRHWTPQQAISKGRLGCDPVRKVRQAQRTVLTRCTPPHIHLNRFYRPPETRIPLPRPFLGTIPPLFPPNGRMMPAALTNKFAVDEQGILLHHGCILTRVLFSCEKYTCQPTLLTLEHNSKRIYSNKQCVTNIEVHKGYRRWHTISTATARPDVGSTWSGACVGPPRRPAFQAIQRAALVKAVAVGTIIIPVSMTDSRRDGIGESAFPQAVIPHRAYHPSEQFRIGDFTSFGNWYMGRSLLMCQATDTHRNLPAATSRSHNKISQIKAMEDREKWREMVMEVRDTNSTR